MAILAIIMVLALLPPLNSILTELIEELLIDRFGLDGYEAAWWHIFPLIIFGYMLIIYPLKIVTGWGRRSEPRDEE